MFPRSLMAYNEEDYLQLSGLQHFSFCRRQWALIHLERQWVENLLTVQGSILHEKAHDGDSRELRGDVLTTRGMKIHSPTLGVSGECDVVELRRCADGVLLSGRGGLWQLYPVEYKRGAPKENDADRLQLCAQGMCLEEMLCCDVSEGALFYGETRRREVVEFTEAMHELYCRRHTPKVKPGKGCNACSLREVCLPKLCRSKKFLKQWQLKKQETITHPFLEEKIPWGLVPYVQALLLARHLRQDADEYPPFLWK